MLEIWILEKDVEQLKKLRASWLSLKDKDNQSIKYMTTRPKSGDEWICIHITLDDYTILTDHNLLHK
jgi:hypothetical protein